MKKIILSSTLSILAVMSIVAEERVSGPSSKNLMPTTGQAQKPSMGKANTNIPTKLPTSSTSSKPVEIKKDDLLNRIKQLPKVFGGTPAFKFQIKDNATWNSIMDDIIQFTTKNSSDDKVIKNNRTALINEANNIFNTTKIVYGSIYSKKRDAYESDKKLFDQYSPALVAIQKAKKALKDETYVIPGKRDARTVLVAYAEQLEKMAQDGYDAYKKLTFTSGSSSKPTGKTIIIYNNTKNKIEVKLKTAAGNKEIILDAEKLSQEIPVTSPGSATTNIVQAISVKPLSSSTFSLKSSLTDKPFNSVVVTKINDSFKNNNSAKFTISTDGQAYSLDVGQKTGNAKSFKEIELVKRLVLRNKTQNKLRINLVDSNGKEIIKNINCSSQDTAIHVIELPLGKDGLYIKAIYINSIPLAPEKLQEFNKALAKKTEPLYDIRMNPDKDKVLWQYFINQAPD